MVNRVKRVSHSGKMDGNQADWDYSCDQLVIYFGYIEDYRDARHVEAEFFEVLQSKFGRPYMRDNSWEQSSGPRTEWYKDYEFPAPLHNMSFSVNSTLVSFMLGLSRCTYSKHQLIDVVDESDF